MRLFVGERARLWRHLEHLPIFELLKRTLNAHAQAWVTEYQTGTCKAFAQDWRRADSHEVFLLKAVEWLIDENARLRDALLRAREVLDYCPEDDPDETLPADFIDRTDIVSEEIDLALAYTGANKNVVET